MAVKWYNLFVPVFGLIPLMVTFLNLSSDESEIPQVKNKD